MARPKINHKIIATMTETLLIIVIKEKKAMRSHKVTHQNESIFRTNYQNYGTNAIPLFLVSTSVVRNPLMCILV